MSDTHLELWKFADAPPALRDHIPSPHANGIVVFVVPGCAVEVVDYLVARWALMGFSVIRKERDDGSIVLTAPDLPASAFPSL
ncbi:MAG: hypothetical protein IPP47_28120 [Bryobacterales bacterium]|nr:hypothetical protein [Bryobacterales bacterium]